MEPEEQKVKIKKFPYLLVLGFIVVVIFDSVFFFGVFDVIVPFYCFFWKWNLPCHYTPFLSIPIGLLLGSFILLMKKPKESDMTMATRYRIALGRGLFGTVLLMILICFTQNIQPGMTVDFFSFNLSYEFFFGLLGIMIASKALLLSLLPTTFTR